VQKADKELAVVDVKMNKLEQSRQELAEFFCEDAKTFRLDDCIKTFQEFFQKFHKASQVCPLPVHFTAHSWDYCTEISCSCTDVRVPPVFQH